MNRKAVVMIAVTLALVVGGIAIASCDTSGPIGKGAECLNRLQGEFSYDPNGGTDFDNQLNREIIRICQTGPPSKTINEATDEISGF